MRCFGDAGYCPAKGVRIQNEKWYRVTLRDVEMRIDDGCFLADTCTTAIMPWEEARKHRDEPLNRCDRIEEYHGPVYAARWLEYGNRAYERVAYVGSLEEAEKVRSEVEAFRASEIGALKRYRERRAREAEMGVDAEWNMECVRECDETLARWTATDWGFRVERIR